MKWFNRTAQGFYEADLVKGVLQKKFSYVLESFGPPSDNNSTGAGSLVLDRRGARDEHRDDQTPKVREAFSVTLLGVLGLSA
jgi:hypothetical protein